VSLGNILDPILLHPVPGAAFFPSTSLGPTINLPVVFDSPSYYLDNFIEDIQTVSAKKNWLTIFGNKRNSQDG
jgi:hypothetical protein